MADNISRGHPYNYTITPVICSSAYTIHFDVPIKASSSVHSSLTLEPFPVALPDARSSPAVNVFDALLTLKTIILVYLGHTEKVKYWVNFPMVPILPR